MTTRVAAVLAVAGGAVAGVAFIRRRRLRCWWYGQHVDPVRTRLGGLTCSYCGKALRDLADAGLMDDVYLRDSKAVEGRTS